MRGGDDRYSHLASPTMSNIQRTMSNARRSNLALSGSVIGQWCLGVGLLFSIFSDRSPCLAREIVPEQHLAQAAEYLWNKQAPDGSWRSEYYGVMRSGESLTPFVLHALLLSADELSTDQAAAAHQAARFIIGKLDEHGALGRSDPDVFEYPVYSTAYAIKSLERLEQIAPLPDREGKHAIERMQGFLADAQYREANGFQPTDVAYGGWGFNAPENHGVVGHMDLAHTHKALSALATFKDKKRLQKIRRRARTFLLLMQRDPNASARQPHPVEVDASTLASTFDGGFYFSPIALSANKAPYDEHRPCWPSYATATCDGVLALLAAGVEPDDTRVQAAKKWLLEHNDVDYPQGVPRDHPEPWGDSVRFYHYSVRAEACRRLKLPLAQETSLVTAVLNHQCPDGSFVNSASPLMKEDDPLVATPLAIVALAHCLAD